MIEIRNIRNDLHKVRNGLPYVKESWFWQNIQKIRGQVWVVVEHKARWIFRWMRDGF